MKTTAAKKDFDHTRRVKTQWNKYVRPFDARSEEEIDSILSFCSETTKVVEDLSGKQCFLAYGGLLGYERSGDLISHDFDIDVVLQCGECSVAEVAEICRQLIVDLIEHGYQIKAKCFGQFFILPPKGGEPTHKIEVFVSWFVGRDYYLYFAVPGVDLDNSLLPLRKISLRGHEFLAPNDSENLLVATYGEDWRTPNPDFKYEMTGARWRPFNSLFFSRNRPNWNRFYDDPNNDLSALVNGNISECVIENVEGKSVLDLGCGSGERTLSWLKSAKKIHAVDFAESAITSFENKLNSIDISNVSVGALNFHDVPQCDNFSKSNNFECVTCFDTIQFLSLVAETELWRLTQNSLKVDGVALVYISDDRIVESGADEYEILPNRPKKIDIYARHLCVDKVVQRANRYDLLLTSKPIVLDDGVFLCFSKGNSA